MGMKRRRTCSCTEPSMTRIQRRGVQLAGLAACLSTPSSAFVSHRPSVLSSPRISTAGSLWSALPIERPVVDADAFLIRTLETSHPPLVGGMDLSSLSNLPPPMRMTPDESRSTDLPNQRLSTEPINDPPSTTTSSLTPPSTLQRWKRRLITREDWKHTHKITGVLFLLASWGLSAYGVVDLVTNGWTKPVTRHGKPFLALLSVLLGSSVLQSFSSVSMACRYRRNQPAVRNTFLCNAAVAILGSVSAVWSSPWYPSALNGAPSMAFYVVMDAIGLIGMGDNLVRLNTLIASRQTTRKHDTELLSIHGWQYWKDVFVYMMPILIGAPFFVAIGWQFGIRHDRTFYLNLLASQRFPHLQAGAVYGMVMVAMGASYSSLIVTLRDKKLIRKQTEGLCLTVVLTCLIGSLYQALKDPGAIAALIGM